MNKESLDNNAVLNIFREELKNVDAVLTGGAIVDILEGRVPKDYDFKYDAYLRDKLDELAVLKYVSRTAITYDLKGYEIQLLKRDPLDFAFTIEQGEYNIKTNTLKNFDEQSFKTKQLIPTSISENFPKSSKFLEVRIVNDKVSATESLMRIPHWRRKGYEINDITYSTLIKIATKNNNIETSS